MKPKIIITSLICLALLSCEKKNEDNYESTGIILGYDLTLCGCCGGWIIKIDNNDETNRFSELPQGSEIDLEFMEKPIKVALNWSKSDEYCGIGIIIESIKLLE